MKKLTLPALVSTLCLAGLLLSSCGKPDAASSSPEISSDGSASSASASMDDAAASASTPDASAASAGDDKSSGEDTALLTTGEARALLAERIDTDKFMILEGDHHLKIDGESYFVFVVADKETNKAVGQLAVNKTTGAKYNYEGEGVLGDYNDFPLFAPDVADDSECDWNGDYSDGERELNILQSSSSSFAYDLDLESGVASISGHTAKDGELVFTYQDDDDSIVLSGSNKGVFTPIK